MEVQQRLVRGTDQAAARGYIWTMLELLTTTKYSPHTKFFYDVLGSRNCTTALYTACRRQNSVMIAFLLHKGFDPYFKICLEGIETSAAHYVAVWI